MKQVILLIAAGILLFSCNGNKNAEKVSVTLFDSSYKPAVFTDGGRMEKIIQAFPVIDKIFKGYADFNHLPRVAYGLVGGIGGEIAAWIAENCFSILDAPVMRCASLDTPVPFNIELEKNFLAKSRLDETIQKLVSY